MLEQQLGEAECQVLITVAVLESRGRATDRRALERFGQEYFGMFREEWSEAYERLVRGQLLATAGEGYRLTSQARPLAEDYRRARPKNRYFYDEFFARAAHSQAHAQFCERVYGRNLAQHGMMDMPQLQRLMEVLRLDEQSGVLELGCGNGMVAEYLSDATGAQVTGVDLSAMGIAQANARTAHKRDRLHFVRADMLAVDFPPATFDAIVAVDSMYYVDDLAGFLRSLQEMVRPGGQMAVFYSAWVPDGTFSGLLLPANTQFGQALQRNRLRYEVIDFTAQEIEHWEKKLQAAQDLKPAFEAEGNIFLYHKRATEAKWHAPYVAAGTVSRYLYHVRL